MSSSAFFNLTAICLALGAVWYWYDNMRARETAIACVKRFCHQQHCQFLDGSVCLRVILFSVAHWRFRRHYDFYYTRNSHQRQRGTVILVGRDIEHFLVDEDTAVM